MPLFVFFVLMLSVTAQFDGNLTSLSDIFPPLTNFIIIPNPSSRPGSQNLTYCCLRAVSTAFEIQNGSLTLTHPEFLSDGMTPEMFVNQTKDVGFPCTAIYNGDPRGAPGVRATYEWCQDNCSGGWGISKPDKLQQWAGPLLAFIVPCLVFSINIPRRRKLEVSDTLFRQTPQSHWRYLRTPLRALLALVIVSADMLIWLCLCFAFAGPMILSGIYEAFLDSRLLNFVADGAKHGGVDNPLCTRLLHVILVGNLDFRLRKGNFDEIHGDPWCDLEKLLKEPKPAVGLPAMLGSQTSFATAVGTPIVFFAGGFIYTLFDILSSLGNNETAHTLAFGMWWMTIPHIAIISSLLLAGNNPLVFQTATRTPNISRSPLFHVLASAYDSRYETEWMYFRGRSKHLWVQSVLGSLPTNNPSALNLRGKATFNFHDWVTISFFTQIILFVPFFLGFLTSYYTPQIGLSCRSLTFLIYFITQTCQVALWVWIMACCTMAEGGILDSPAHHTHGAALSKQLRYIGFWTLACLFGITSTFAAIGGTIMQLLGVYSNCLCALPIQYWMDRYSSDMRASISLGKNSGEDILAARTWWLGTGGSAVAFLCLTSGWGWWYQRRLRGMFKEAAERLST